MAVFVLDKRGKPLMPCSEKRARLLLERGRARVHRVMPFVIRLIDRRVEDSILQPLRVKVEPGSKVTGLALVRDSHASTMVLNLFELVHRGSQITKALSARSNFRRRRRSANLRYRAPRRSNVSRRRAGWLPPSLQHRVDTTLSWIERLVGWAPVSGLASELVRFDIKSTEIVAEYQQQVDVISHETRGYLLEKWGYRCAYCDAFDLPLRIDTIATHGTGASRVSDLTLACLSCLARRNSSEIHEFITDEFQMERLLRRAKAPHKDLGAVDGARSMIGDGLKRTGLPVELSSGGNTKWNRSRLGLPKSQALDAVCVGSVSAVSGWKAPTLEIKCSGRGRYQRTLPTAQGFPRGYLMRNKRVHNFQTGDRVRANVPTGKKAGIHTGRVSIRASGSFNVKTQNGVVQGISHKHCLVQQRADGYSYLMLGLSSRPPSSHATV